MRCKHCRSVLAEGHKYCFECGDPVDPPESQSTGVIPETYIHEEDTLWTTRLHKTSGLDNLLKKINEHGLDDLLQMQYAGSYLEANAGVFPRYSRLLSRACKVLGLKEIPKTYIMMEDRIDGFLVGSEKPVVILHYDTIDRLSPRELLFFVGRLVGHIVCGHVPYLQAAMLLPEVSGSLGAATFGVGGMIAAGVQAALENWKRAAALTADRAGYLACGNERAAFSALMKMAGAPVSLYKQLNPEHLEAQAATVKRFSTDGYGKIAKALSASIFKHPWTILRAAELRSWVDERNDAGNTPVNAQSEADLMAVGKGNT